MKISIIFENNTSGKITINKNIYNFKNEKKIDFEIEQNGFFLLKLLTENDCAIKDILIENDSIRELIYLGYSDLKNIKIQPYVDIKSQQEWSFPLILPLSDFLNFIKTNIRNGYFGKNLFDIFKIYIPESIEINSSFPRVLQDYFKKDSSFSVIENKGKNVEWFSNECELPFQSCSLYYPKEELSNEFMKNFSDIDWNLSVSHQVSVNKKEYNLDNSQTWKKFEIIKKDLSKNWRDRFTLESLKWPTLYKVLESIPNENIFDALFLELPSGGFIYPHNDSSIDHWGYQNNVECLYIPFLGHEKDVYFKFGNFGCIDLTRINFINNTKYPHAVVNQSNNTRFVLSLKLKSDYLSWKSKLL